jgi:hypothetical protein
VVTSVTPGNSLAIIRDVPSVEPSSMIKHVDRTGLRRGRRHACRRSSMRFLVTIRMVAIGAASRFMLGAWCLPP